MRYIVLVSIVLLIAANLLADQTKPLFIIRRTKNTNEVHYDVNITSYGKINSKKPVISYWIMLEKNGQKENIGFFEKKAYGFKCKYDKDKEVYRLVIKSFKEREIEVSEDEQDVKAEIEINGKPAYLEKMFITESEGKLVPKVRFIELFGEDKNSGEKVYEKINI